LHAAADADSTMISETITYFLTLWLSLQLSLDDVSYSSSGSIMQQQTVARYDGGLSAQEVAYWTQHMAEVLREFPEEDIEFYVPQLTAVMSRRDARTRNPMVSGAAATNMGAFLMSKCRSRQLLGMNVVWQLQAMAADADKGAALDPNIRSNAAVLAHDFQIATMQGCNLPDQMRARRQAYHGDSMQLVQRLVNASFRMRSIPHKFRLAELQFEVRELNKCLLRRMHTRGRSFEMPSGGEWAIDEEAVAAACPEAANFALHLPMSLMDPVCAHCHQAVRVLRLVKELCHPLPSRERAPFMVTAEVLQTKLGLGSHRLYLAGDRVGITALDVIEGRAVPQDLLQEMQKEVNAADQGHKEALDLFVQPGIPNNQRLVGEEEDKAFFDRAFDQYLMTGDTINPLVQRMRVILTQVYGNLGDLRERIYRHSSPFGRLRGWKLASFIVKAGDDVRQEALAMQVISLVDRIFKLEGLPLWLRPYSIICTGPSAGLVECITDAKTIDDIKKRTPNFISMGDFFERLYMGRATGLYGRAQDNFVRSLAGYSIITYLLQVKDRHNANIMIDVRGHLIHIDFGFILGASPGLWKHETAPFKLTQDYVDMLGGDASPNWEKFKQLFLAGFRAVQAHIESIVSLVKVMVPPADKRALWQVELLKKRFTDLQTDAEILALIDRSANSWTTNQYDLVQYLQNGILP
jgi:hypothetical protein